MKTGIIVLVYFFIWVFYIPTKWRLFEKLGRKGWEGIIPVYDQYVFYKTMWNIKFFCLNIIFVIFAIIFATAYSFTDLAGYNIAVNLTNVARLMIQFMLCAKIASGFRKGKYFGIWLYFFPVICYPILAFGKAMPANNEKGK